MSKTELFTEATVTVNYRSRNTVYGHMTINCSVHVATVTVNCSRVNYVYGHV